MSQDRKAWAQSDEHLLTVMIEAGASWHEIGGAVGRAWRACVQRARFLGLSTRGAYGKPKAWTDVEIVTLHTMWINGDGDRTIGKALGRDTKSINAKRRHLGLTRTSAQGLAVARLVRDDGDWPRACAMERKRGEALLDMFCHVEGYPFGKPRVNNTPSNAVRVLSPRDNVRGFQSSAGFAS